MRCFTDEELDAFRAEFLSGCNVEQMASALVAEAERQGLVLTVEQENLQPLAMGNYRTTVSVRSARTLSASRQSAPLDAGGRCGGALSAGANT